MEYKNKPFPPFGALFNQLIKINLKLNISPWVFCGKNAWKEAVASHQNGQLSLCLPFEKQADEYAWPVTDLSLILNHTGGLSSLDLCKIAHQLILSGARQVTIFCEHGNGLKIFNKANQVK